MTVRHFEMNPRTSPAKPALRQKAQLMSASEIERTLVRLAYEIVEKNGGVDGLGLSEFVVAACRLPSAWARLLLASRMPMFRSARWISRSIATICLRWGRSQWCRNGRSVFRLKTRILFWSTMFCSRDGRARSHGCAVLAWPSSPGSVMRAD